MTFARFVRRAAAMASLTLPLLSVRAGAQQSPPPAAARWWHDITVLADDSMRGRRTGTADYLKAAQYVAEQFAAAGLARGGTSGFFQTAHLATARLVVDSSIVVLERDGARDTLRLGTDAAVRVAPSTRGRVSAPLVFVGYGLHLPGVYDDLAHVSLRGKVAVFLNRLPAGLNATMLAHGRASRWSELQRLGAVAAIGIADPPAPGDTSAPWWLRRVGRPAMGLASDPDDRGILITLRARAARALLAGSGHSYDDLLASAEANRTLPVFALAPRLRARLRIERMAVNAPNVVGVLRGSDPRLRHQYLVVSAHLDHLGVGRPVNGDSIYNGAMDNASGIATLLETARAFRDRHVAPRRSIIFLAVTGEEEGELGSAYFAMHPTVPARDVVADLNTDMYLPIIPLRGVFAYGWDESDLGRNVSAVLRARGLANLPDPEPEQVRFIRSDQYSFIRRGIPAMAFKTGYTNGSPEMQTVTTWLRTRYHRPSDDLAQPVNFQTAVAFDAMYFDIVRAVADRATRPAWYPRSVFATIPRGGE